jgi:hypothetical protein
VRGVNYFCRRIDTPVPLPKTLDRLLRPTRVPVSGKYARRRAMPAVQRHVPVRTFAEREEPLPGESV